MDLVETIKWIQRETLALKQAQMYGLGRVDLSTSLVDIHIPSGDYTGKNLYIKLTFYNAVSTPMIQFWNDDSYDTANFVIDSYSAGVMVLKIVSNWWSNNADYDFKIEVAATSVISNAEWYVE